MRIYVASSWRNAYQQDVVHALRDAGHDVYDFRNPGPGLSGFSWSEIDPEWRYWTEEECIAALDHPIAKQGFAHDFTAMEASEAGVLVMPCGRSAHIEAGWLAGQGKPLLILLDNGEGEYEAELMYKLADSLHTGLGSLLLRLQEIEDGVPAVAG